ncbi:hypothetical protein V0M98_33120 (plasmid) [Pseudomonas silesiensis]|uniref:hypothetical protein n=1 Tax=Pseudomonas silesiensis TaxID=1853130 RepID=UPI0030D04B92
MQMTIVKNDTDRGLTHAAAVDLCDNGSLPLKMNYKRNTMLDADAANFAFACFVLMGAYFLGNSHGTKSVKRRVRQAVEQNQVDVDNGYPNGYNNVSLADRIRNIL